MKKTIVSLVTTLALAASTYAADIAGKSLVLKTKDGRAIQGYDPVAYFIDNKAVKGNTKFSSEHDGAKYLFASAEHKALFDGNPEKYAPAYGGFCGYAASINKVRPVNVKLWSIVDGRLVLQHTKSAVELWNKDVRGNLERADRNWPGLVEREVARQAASSRYPLTWPGFYDYGNRNPGSPRVGSGSIGAHNSGADMGPMPGDLAWPGF